MKLLIDGTRENAAPGPGPLPPTRKIVLDQFPFKAIQRNQRKSLEKLITPLSNASTETTSSVLHASVATTKPPATDAVAAVSATKVVSTAEMGKSMEMVPSVATSAGGVNYFHLGFPHRTAPFSPACGSWSREVDMWGITGRPQDEFVSPRSPSLSCSADLSGFLGGEENRHEAMATPIPILTTMQPMDPIFAGPAMGGLKMAVDGECREVPPTWQPTPQLPPASILRLPATEKAKNKTPTEVSTTALPRQKRQSAETAAKNMKQSQSQKHPDKNQNAR